VGGDEQEYLKCQPPLFSKVQGAISETLVSSAQWGLASHSSGTRCHYFAIKSSLALERAKMPVRYVRLNLMIINSSTTLGTRTQPE